MTKQIPLSVQTAVDRVHAGESVQAACSWVYRWLTEADRKAVDAFIVESGHKLGYQPGTAEWRFGELVREAA